jgi:hypothetical protein
MILYISMSEIIEEKNKKTVSFSQYSGWFKCPHSWYLNYLKGLRKYEASLNTCFGTAIHNTIQDYIKLLYTEGAEVADEIDLIKKFRDEFAKILLEEKDTFKEPYTDDDVTEFLFDGEDILKTFSNSANRIKHFPSRKYEFIGVEVPLDVPIKNNVRFIAYVDLILRDKTSGKYKIWDFKTSSMGWNKYQVADESKYSQLLLYKAFYSKQFNVPLDAIDVEFFILKRKLYENVAFPQNRIQIFEPANAKNYVSKSLVTFTSFIDECFTPEGTYKEDGYYPKVPGKSKKNCKYCTHYKTNCDGKETKDDKEDN